MPLSDAFTPGGCYLDSATYGLPPVSAQVAIRQATDHWAAGTYDPLDADAAIARARAAFARLHGVAADTIAIAPQVSPLVATVAAGLPAGARVLTAEGDFTSLLFPFAAAGARVEAVPLAGLAEAIDAAVDVVAVSAV